MSTSIGVSVFECYETNVEFNLRFMVDTSVIGCNWIELPVNVVVVIVGVVGVIVVVVCVCVICISGLVVCTPTCGCQGGW